MLVSLNWLKQYVDISDHEPNELAELITKTGIEVESVASIAENITGVVVGFVEACSPHPNADKLSVCQVNTGQETYQIVCGAPNIASGQKVAVALPDTTLPGNFKIKQTELRGVTSNGMICSLQELGVAEKDVPKAFVDGIFVFPDDVETGANACKLLNLDDVILELGLTPNRSDCLSMIGVAYEVAAILDQDFKPEAPRVSTKEESAADRIQVQVEDPEANPYYGAFVIDNINVAPSPLWMRNRLTAAGIRPINNVVDITNYVLLEYGQPLHAFDYDRFGSKEVVVLRAQDQETITTLDGQERTLNADHLLITNGKEPMALAGVMGGADTEVQEDTTTILLESAYFAPSIVRQSSKDHGLRSESSIRFEKGVDPNRVKQAGMKACELLQTYAGGQVIDGAAEFDHLDRSERTVQVELTHVNNRLGTHLQEDEIEHILRRLQFQFEKDGDLYTVSVPTRRGDIELFEDMLEEFARLHGYDQLPYTLPGGAAQAGGLTLYQQLKRNVKTYFEGAGLDETITYSLTTESRSDQLVSPDVRARGDHPVRLSMPMSEEHSHLRLSMLPEMLASLTYNVARKQHDLAYFELGSVFINDEATLSKQPYEQLRAAGAITGKWNSHDWQQENKPVDFFVVKGIIEGLEDLLDITLNYEQAKLPDMHPGRTAVISYKNETIGFVGQIHPNLQAELDLKETFVFDLNAEALIANYEKEETFQTIPRYPSVSRDIALVVDESAAASHIAATIFATGRPLIRDVRVFDVYQGEHLPEGKKSLAFNLLYLDPNRTLKDKEVEEAHQRILEAVKGEHQAELRS
ncbi:phenylalanine--tRNA ligase subunit beta [Thalassobacillus sp. CUG 92003]|uniref:phenylalanine--tRNA ligase subunit beta n=1 Tax=Thalassobacillus sp. CUG 92003 TaxID=2736641 RepID=UPI0015E744AE|nr:phenylalanine--tRNA ligase subunit beta [Thalassobacillus sp. CUG 92003]